MDDVEELVARIVRAAGGTVVGRIRLQKEIYLLEQLGLNSGFSFSYHHYGPYSEDLTDAVDGAKAFNYVREEIRPRRSDGVPFSVYAIGERAPALGERISALPVETVSGALSVMQKCSATVLEIAATIHWLRTYEQVADWRTELVRRKGSKTAAGRTEEALTVLSNLGLAN
jgi:hypothetical protein